MNHLAEAEYRFACLVWDNEPLPSGQLVKLSAAELGWKKSTTYTVLKKLCERGILQNEGGTVTSLVKKEEVQCAESAAVVEKRIARGRSCGRCWCLQLWGFSIRTHSGIRIFPTGISVPPVCGSGGRFCGNIGKIPPRLPLC